MATAEIKTALADYLRRQNLPPNPAWLNNFTATLRPNTPLLSLQKTALFRILATDLLTSVQPPPTALLPPNVSSPEARERRLPGPIAVQVLDIEDIGRSRWSQVEQLEAQERGETTKGREIIRVVDEEPQSSSDSAATEPNSTGPHKVLLQDARGGTIYAFTFAPIPGVSVQHLGIGAKLIIRDVPVARGVALLEARNVELLGGKVDSWDRKWRAERKEALKRQAGMDSSPAEVGGG